MNRQVRVEIAFAAAAIALGIYLLFGSFTISLGSGYDRIGPRFFPYLIAGGLIISGLLMWTESLSHKKTSSNLSMDLMSFITLLLALLLCVILLQRLGFILSMTLLFAMVARAFKSRYLLRDLMVGLVLAVTVYFAFTSGLGLVLPGGVLARIV